LSSASSGRSRLLTGWGRTAPTRAEVHRPSTADELGELLARTDPRGLIARGLGRSYGDAAQNAGGLVALTTGLSGVTIIDTERRRAIVHASTSIDRLTTELLPHGCIPPVTPGTRHVTVGGAIACDVHGKNHHRDGSFGDSVRWLELLRPDGEQVRVSRDERPELFAATLGGMGLTGVVLAAELDLLPVQTAFLHATDTRRATLDDTLALLSREDPRHRYSIAWLDLAAGRGAYGRGVVSTSEHAALGELPPEHRTRPLEPASAGPSRLAAPRWVPSGLLRPATIRAFNEAWFRRTTREPVTRLTPLHSFFYPLDGMRGWNRLYGGEGLVQHQILVPEGHDGVLHAILDRVRRARAPVALATLKRLGRGRGLLSFPRPGWTLALDLPARTPGLGELLDSIDLDVANVAGSVYLAKDARLRPDMMRAMYPDLPAWRRIRRSADPGAVLRSDLARRLELL